MQYCNFIKLEENTLMYRCLKCKNISYRSIKPLIDKVSNTYRLCNNNSEKFVLLLRKRAYLYEYMDHWKRFNEKLPSKEEFYSNLNMESINDKDYEPAKKVWNTLNIKNLGEYHDQYVQSDTVLLPDVFENFRTVCLKEYKLDPCYFVSAPGVA